MQFSKYVLCVCFANNTQFKGINVAKEVLILLSRNSLIERKQNTIL